MSFAHRGLSWIVRVVVFRKCVLGLRPWLFSLSIVFGICLGHQSSAVGFDTSAPLMLAIVTGVCPWRLSLALVLRMCPWRLRLKLVFGSCPWLPAYPGLSACHGRLPVALALDNCPCQLSLESILGSYRRHLSLASCPCVRGNRCLQVPWQFVLARVVARWPRQLPRQLPTPRVDRQRYQQHSACQPATMR